MSLHESRRGTRSPTPQRADIQGLRGLAVALVVAAHLGIPGLAGGFVGVDVFFVVSGFLITSILLRDASDTGRIRLAAFYARRARRILPAATLVLVATTLYASQQLSVVRVREVVDDVRWSAVFAANIHFSRLGTDYFAQGLAVSPVQHYWSLAVEEQFYLVWPSALALLVLVCRKHLVFATALLTGGCLGASFAWSMVLTERSPVAAYFSSATRSWELAAGALLAVARPGLVRLGRTARAALAASGLTSVVFAAMAFRATTPFPGWPAAVPVAGAAALVAAGIGGTTVGAGRLLTAPPLTRLGDISYSLYLWHWPVLVLGAGYVQGWSPLWAGGAEVVVAILLATTTYALVENPVRRTRRLRRKVSLVLWPAALAVVAASGLWATSAASASLQQRAGGAILGATVSAPRIHQHQHQHRTHVAPARPSVQQRVHEAIQRADQHRAVPFPLANLEGDTWESRFCHAAGVRSTSRLCPIGDRAKDVPVVVAYGDSHIGQWLPALDRVGRALGFQVVPLVKGGCSPFDVRMTDGSTAEFTSCYDWRHWALERIRRLRPEVVLVGSRSASDRVIAEAGEDPLQVWEAGATSTVQTLDAVVPRVEVIADLPELGREPADCLTAPGSDLGDCIAYEPERVRDSNRMLRRITDRPGVRFVDVRPLLCEHGRCPVVVDRIVTYGDFGHISVTWSRQVADDLARMLDLYAM